jgi:hypothetical protein
VVTLLVLNDDEQPAVVPLQPPGQLTPPDQPPRPGDPPAADGS